MREVGGVSESLLQLRESHFVELLPLKRSSRDMLGFYANLVVTLLEVNLGEIFRAGHMAQQLVDALQGVLVLEGDMVECAVVDAKS